MTLLTSDTEYTAAAAVYDLRVRFWVSAYYSLPPSDIYPPNLTHLLKKGILPRSSSPAISAISGAL